MSDAALGSVVSEHKGRLAAGGVAWYVGGIVFVFSFVGLGKEAMAGAFENVPFFLISIAASGLWLFYNYTRWAQRLTIHAHGFVWKRVVRAPVTVRFDEIVSADMRSYGSRRSMHTKGVHTEVELRLRDGRRVTLTNDMKGVEALAGYAGSAPAQAAPSPWGG